MEKKENLLKKIHLKDYTNQLEKVLEKKSFSLQTKNLLLSMVYKIENAYPDYQKTKVEVYDKGDFLEDVIGIIENNCQEIELVKNLSEEQNSLGIEKYLLDKEKGKIMALGNELTLLKAILELGQEPLCLPEEESLLQKPISSFLNLGSKMHEVEVIRDFNGWSWDVILKEIPEIELNLAFQNFVYLLGYEFIWQWMQNESGLADYLMLAQEKLAQEFGVEKAKKAIFLFCKLSIEMLAKKDKEQKKLWKKLKKENKEELERLNHKKEYLEEVTNKKKELTKEIEKIDKMVNNKELLQKEYEERNAKLPNKEKIFSIRHFINKLEIERQDLVDEMKQYNVLIDPKGYVTRKEKISKKAEFYSILDIEGKKDTREGLLELCLLFLSCLQIKIAKAQTKQEIIVYFYVLRYYRFLPFDSEYTLLKEIEKLQESFEKTIRILLEKAYKLDIIEKITDEPEINYQIIRNLFDSKMIDLNHTVIETRVEEGKLFASYYDTNILETTAQIQSSKTVKLKKKTKLFV